MRIFLSSEYLSVPAALHRRSDITWVRSLAGDGIPEAHLYIWDYEEGLDLQSFVSERPSAQHLVVADSKHLDSLSQIQNTICVLLKPVSPFTLKAFVELALKAWEVQGDAQRAETLKVDRDTLLQYILEVNLRLQEYDQNRNTFLARALHDLRTPLTALDGYCGLLADGMLGEVNTRQGDLLDRMRFSTKRLRRLADGALNLLLQGCLEKAEHRESDIAEILKRALYDVKPLIQERYIHVETQMTPPERVLLADPEQIQQVFVNLLENSCRFASKNGYIRVCGFSVQPLAGGEREPIKAAVGYQTDISDSGPGVPAELAERIFEEYASFSGSSDRSGGGLGLAICKAIMAAHGGSIWATPSKDRGQFSFILPLSDRRIIVDGKTGGGSGV